jgi:hypothetical protein
MPHYSRHFVRLPEIIRGSHHFRIAGDSIEIHQDALLGVGAAPSNEVDLHDMERGMDNN